jgi:hypothetical protein
MRSCNRYDSISDFDAETIDVNIRLRIMYVTSTLVYTSTCETNEESNPGNVNHNTDL